MSLMENSESSYIRAWKALKPFVKVGEFVLRSGRTSDLYIDVKGALLSRNGAYIIVSLARKLAKIRAPDTTWAPHYIGYGYGGALLCAASTAVFVGRQSTVFRGEKKDYGLKSAPIGPIPEEDSVLVLLEDVVTTESSIRECLDQVGEREWSGNKDIIIMSVVDRRLSSYTNLEVHSLFDEETIRGLMNE